jgi:predicted transporter
VGATVLLALALIGAGVALRRLRAEHRVGHDTRFPLRPHRVG